MIAELHGKISSSGSNLSDRLEDKLTGDVFGTLRYLPFHIGMEQILCATNIHGLAECVENSNLVFWGDRLQFWPYHKDGEMDAFLELDNAVIGIEIKYMSGLSSDDEIENSSVVDTEREESRNQLARESRILKQWCPENKKAFLLFIAKESECVSVCSNVQARDIIEPGVELGYISWQEILKQLSQIEPSEPYQQLILRDVCELLKRKRFERFNSFVSSGDLPVNVNEYYNYGDSLLQTKNPFDFNFYENINEGDHYEYR